MMLHIDWSTYRGEGGELKGYAATMIGQKIRGHAYANRLRIWKVFRDTVLHKFKHGTPEDFITPYELICIAAQCGPEHSHTWSDAMVVLYFALGLNPRNVRETFLRLFKEANIRLTDRMNQTEFYNIEFYLGLNTGTLYDIEAWGRN